MTASNVIVVTIDGFGVAAAGAYGQTSLPTPGWDALATSAITFDFVEAPGASHERAFVGFIRSEANDRGSVYDAVRHLAERGASTCIGGDFEAIPPAFSVAFDRYAPFRLEEAAQPVDEEDETHALRWLAKSERFIEEVGGLPIDDASLLWLHHDASSSAWDSPLEWREALRDEEDPPAYADVAPPVLDARGDDRDPDRFLPYVFAWAGQAAAWDRLAEGLHLLWKRADAKRPTTMIVLGLRGYALGEHGVVGDGDLAPRGLLLHEERLHVPFFVLPPGGVFPGKRALGIRKADELLAKLLADSSGIPGPQTSLAEELEEATSGEPDPAYAVVEEGACVSVRTALWRYLRDEAGSRLYLKPDDKWEANDVASRRRETVEAFERWLEERSRGNLLPLPPEVTEM